MHSPLPRIVQIAPTPEAARHNSPAFSLSVALIKFAPFDAIDELIDLGRISGGNVIVIFHRRRSRRSYARQKRTPRPELKYFLFHDCMLQGHCFPPEA